VIKTVDALIGGGGRDGDSARHGDREIDRAVAREAFAELVDLYLEMRSAGEPFAEPAKAATVEVIEALSGIMPREHAEFFARAPLVMLDSALKETLELPLSKAALAYGLSV